MAFRSHPHPDELDTDDENDGTIDPELRLRTVRTAASTMAESVRSEQRAQKAKQRKRSLKFFRSRSLSKRKADVPEEDVPDVPTAVQITGPRRNIYVNVPLSPAEADVHGEPHVRYVRNKVRTASE